jgi:hypothetical protein
MVMMEGEWNGVRVFRAMQHSQQDEYIHASVHLKLLPGFLDKGRDTGKLS